MKTLGLFTQLIEQYQTEHNVPANDVAAALAVLLQGDTPLLLKKKPHAAPPQDWGRDDSRGRERKPRNNEKNKERSKSRKNRDSSTRSETRLEEGMERYRLEVGHKHEVKPGNIVGAIANEAGLESKHIGRIDIREDYSVVDLPSGMPKDVFNTLKKTWVSGTQLKISVLDSSSEFKDNKNSSTRKTKPKSKSRNKPKNKDRKKRKRKATAS